MPPDGPHWGGKAVRQGVEKRRHSIEGVLVLQAEPGNRCQSHISLVLRLEARKGESRGCWSGAAATETSTPARPPLRAPGQSTGTTDNYFRWRTASNKHTPAETETLRLLTSPAIGMEKTLSQCSRVRRRMPLPSEPNTSASGPLRSVV